MKTHFGTPLPPLAKNPKRSSHPVWGIMGRCGATPWEGGWSSMGRCGATPWEGGWSSVGRCGATPWESESHPNTSGEFKNVPSGQKDLVLNGSPLKRGLPSAMT
jgi:hypothetical protein